MLIFQQEGILASDLTVVNVGGLAALDTGRIRWKNEGTYRAY